MRSPAIDAFDVLSAPARRRILELLLDGERTSGDVVAAIHNEFGISQAAVSQHLGVLRDAGFASVRQDGARRYYAVRPDRLMDIDAWLESFRGLWLHLFESLDAEIARGKREREAAGGNGRLDEAGEIDSRARPVTLLRSQAGQHWEKNIMTNGVVRGMGTKDDPWQLTTPSGKGDYQMYRDEAAGLLVCVVGTTELGYQWRCIEDLHAMLKAHGDWMPLGSADEQKPAAEGTVEAWARSPENPVGGWYGTKKGLRGRFANYVPPLMEALGLAEVEHNARNNRMRAI